MVMIHLEKSLAKHGFSKDDITDVFLTHLHFDHCGGALKEKEISYYLLLKMLLIGAMQSIGNGQHSPTTGKRHLF